MGPFFDNRADIISKVPARERPVNFGIRPSANFIKQKQVVSQETHVCFLITRLMNNQIKGRKKGYFPKSREIVDKGAVAVVKSLSQLGCVSQNSHALVSRGRKSQGNPMQKVLEPVQRVRLTSSSEYPGREKTIAWKNTSQTSSSAKLCPKQGLESCSRLRQQKSRRKESLQLIQDRVCT